MRFATTSVLATAILAVAAHAATPNMKEGLWEITMTMDIPGVPPGANAPRTMQQCIGKKEIEKPGGTPGAGPDQMSKDCQVSDYKMQGNTATWKMACKGQNEMTGSGSMTYGGTSYSGKNTFTMKNQGGPPQTMSMAYSGKYVGPCKK